MLVEAATRTLALMLAATALIGGTTYAEAKRVALVIGNSAYAVKPLANPSRDAAAMASVLKDQLGFDRVTLKTDIGRGAMVEALNAFQVDAEGSDVAIVYFAGHGTALEQIETYLVPVDAKLARESDLEDEAVSLKSVLRRLEGARELRLVILDACRNPPFALAGRKRDGATRGLLRVEPEDNTLIAYATKDGTTADDGEGQHSPFTASLLRHIATPGIDVTFVFRAVRDEVLKETGRRQQPHVYGTLGMKPVYLRSGGVGGTPPTVQTPAPAVQPAPATPEVDGHAATQVDERAAEVRRAKAEAEVARLAELQRQWAAEKPEAAASEAPTDPDEHAVRYGGLETDTRKWLLKLGRGTLGAGYKSKQTAGGPYWNRGQSAGFEACRSECSGDSRCKAFAWGGGVAVTGTCHLYDAKDFETIDVTGSIVGYKK